jgi:hypothetical protein
MIDNLKKILNEDQDPKAIEKITAKLENLLMSSEEVGYIAVQKKPAVTILPDSIVVTNKRIILCKPKNLGLSMEFIDFSWDEISGTFVKEGILGSDFTFSTNTDLTHTVDYLPKTQARKLYTYAKEQLDALKNPIVASPEVMVPIQNNEVVEEVAAQEATSFVEEESISQPVPDTEVEVEYSQSGKAMKDLTKDELFEKLQNYKKLLDNGLILQSEYDRLKAEVLQYL